LQVPHKLRITKWPDFVYRLMDELLQNPVEGYILGWGLFHTALFAMEKEPRALTVARIRKGEAGGLAPACQDGSEAGCYVGCIQCNPKRFLEWRKSADRRGYIRERFALCKDWQRRGPEAKNFHREVYSLATKFEHAAGTDADVVAEVIDTLPFHLSYALFTNLCDMS
jgi:hypothetical protein